MDDQEPLSARREAGPGSPRPANSAVAPLAVGSVLGRTFSVWARNVVAFGLISLVVHAPLFLYHAQASPYERYGRPSQSYFLWEFLLSAGLGIIAAGPMVYGVVRYLRGQAAGLGECISMGLRRFGSVLLTAILLFLALAGVIFVVGLFVGVIITGVQPRSIEQGLGIAFTMLALIAVPTLYVYCRLWVAIPVTILENPGPATSLSRSRVLTSRNTLRIGAVVVLIFLVQFGTQLLIGVVAAPSARAVSAAVGWIDVVLSAAVFGPLRAVACAIGYHDLRVAKEGVGADELARVFD